MSSDNDSGPTLHPLPQMPTMSELMDAFDHIAGVQTIKTKGPDGKNKLVTSRLPRTKEETERFEKLGNTIKNAFLSMEQLIQYDPLKTVDYAPFLSIINKVNSERGADMAALSNLPDFNKYVNDFKEVGNTIIQDEFKKAENENKAYLANRGYADSSAAIAMRNSLVSEKAKALAQNDLSGNLYGQQLQAADQVNRSNEFGFREKGRIGQLQSAEAEHQLNLGQFNQLNAGRQTGLQNQSSMLGLADAVVDRDKRYAMTSQTANQANKIMNQENAQKLGWYNAEANNVNQANNLAIQQHNNRGPSFGQSLMQLGGMGIGAYFGGPMGGMFGGSVGSVAGDML